ncbi:MAG TPA: tRNA glutamyl-Q(34) synthetase GluQRS [Pseudomonadales bacterium]|nr:tRNA glutamyl-Q(34) synthetase GluQRS [Pseudomonadales bacterium]
MIGRFAPSPTGPLHFGSLLTAVASYVHARAGGGRWLLRVEDLDTLRCVPGAADSILRTLDRHGLRWDDLAYQHERTDLYRQALDRLVADGHTFVCTCSRSQLQDTDVYPGTCRTKDLPHTGEGAIRVRVPVKTVGFVDGIQGPYSQRLDEDVGDFVVFRRDGIFAYQLAVVVDDATQGITEVVRGADLLDNTPRQLLLFELLGAAAPTYLHVPVLADRSGRKLSKQTAATAVRADTATGNLHAALDLLGQNPPASLAHSTPAEVLAWAVDHWSVAAIPRGVVNPGFVCV